MTRSARSALKRAHEEHGHEITFITLYVREAHPGDEVPQPTTMADKIAHAREYARRDHIPWTIAVDDLEGSLHQQLDEKPSSVYLVDREGLICARLLWSNDYNQLRRAIAATLESEVLGDIHNRLLPNVRGVRHMMEILRAAGREAVDDLRQEIPSVYAMARVADKLRSASGPRWQQGK